MSLPRSFIAALAVSLVAVACGGDTAETTMAVTTTVAPTTTAAPTTTTTTTVPPTTTTTVAALAPSPLNGLPAEDEANLDRRVIAVKIDNHWNARPQSGIEQADAVYELLVEAGLTRFIALFHDNDAEFLGPMRSGRPTDPTLVRPLDATFVISGAQNWVQSVIRNHGVPFIGEVRPATFRISGRRAPHNLYVDTTRLRSVADARGYGDAPPADMFDWGPLPDGGVPATEITFDWSSSTTVTWRYENDRYVRYLGDDTQNWRSADGEVEEPISVDTLIVLFARRYTASGSSGSAVPAMDTVGTGRALVFAAGEVVEGTWERTDTTELFSLRTVDGDVLSVPAGVPWISVFPDNRQVSW